ncbi:MAG: response regulator transcription factor [Saprospiraceae bacterium]|nr:response regulator transcription factor [Saprospiraceae bacterium]
MQSQQKSNQINISTREQEIVNLTVEAYTTIENANKSHLSKNTIKSHRKNLLRKFQVRNKVELLRKSITRGFLSIS